jgi:CRP-like cAMP-binding protein
LVQYSTLCTEESRTILDKWETLLGPVAEHTDVPAGGFIFRAGEEPSIALIRAGTVRIFLRTDAGREITIAYARPGDLIGLGTLLAGTRRWNAEAVTDTTVVPLTFEQVQAAATRSPELSWLITEYIATRASTVVLALADTNALPVATRIARHLREVAQPTPDGPAVVLISHQRLAEAVGTVREVVSRQLRAFRMEGVIDTKPGQVTLVNEDRLERIAAGPPHVL